MKTPEGPAPVPVQVSPEPTLCGKPYMPPNKRSWEPALSEPCGKRPGHDGHCGYRAQAVEHAPAAEVSPELTFAAEFAAARGRVAHLVARTRQTETGPCNCTHPDDAEACRRDRQRPLTGRCTCLCHPAAPAAEVSEPGLCGEMFHWRPCCDPQRRIHSDACDLPAGHPGAAHGKKHSRCAAPTPEAEAGVPVRDAHSECLTKAEGLAMHGLVESLTAHLSVMAKELATFGVTVEPVTRFEAFTPDAKAAYPVAPSFIIKRAPAPAALPMVEPPAYPAAGDLWLAAVGADEYECDPLPARRVSRYAERRKTLVAPVGVL